MDWKWLASGTRQGSLGSGYFEDERGPYQHTLSLYSSTRSRPCAPYHAMSSLAVCRHAIATWRHMAAVVMVPGGAGGRSAWYPSVLCLGCTACKGNGQWEPTGRTGTARRRKYPQQVPYPFRSIATGALYANTAVNPYINFVTIV